MNKHISCSIMHWKINYVVVKALLREHDLSEAFSGWEHHGHGECLHHGVVWHAEDSDVCSLKRKSETQFPSLLFIKSQRRGNEQIFDADTSLVCYGTNKSQESITLIPDFCQVTFRIVSSYWGGQELQKSIRLSIHLSICIDRSLNNRYWLHYISSVKHNS